MTSSSFVTNVVNKSCVALRRASGSGLVYGDGVSLSILMVGQGILNYCFKWPFSVDGESVRCLGVSTLPVLNRWQGDNFFMDLVNVEGAVMKHVAWRNWANYFLALFIWKMALADFVV